MSAVTPEMNNAAFRACPSLCHVGNEGLVQAYLAMKALDPEVEMLRHIVQWTSYFVDISEHLEADLRSAHAARADAASQWMREDDYNFRANLKNALTELRRLLNGPVILEKPRNFGRVPLA